VLASSSFACLERPELDGSGAGSLRIAADASAANSCGRSATASGTLQIRSLDERSSTQVTASELSAEREARRVLPAGLYMVSWVPAPSADDVGWRLREPKLLTVAAGRVTELRVRHEAPACDHLARTD
jgi:hypothetical protein